MTLIEFLLARIAEDEAAAGRGGWHNGGGVFANDNYGCLLVQPDRVLAECEAKRSIIEMHDAMPAENVYCMTCDENHDWPCATLKTVAAVYADHPDFREEWRP